MKEVVFPDTMIVARVDNTQLLPSFLNTIWKSAFVRRQIESSAQTTNGTFKVTQGVIESTKILVPPIEAQRAFDRFEELQSESSAKQRESLRASDLIFNSLVSRSFSGLRGTV